jgi:hypothetical protein
MGLIPDGIAGVLLRKFQKIKKEITMANKEQTKNKEKKKKKKVKTGK